MYQFFNSKEPRFIGMDFTFRNQSEDVAVIDIDGKIGRDLIQEWLTGEKSENTGKEIKKKIRGISASKIIVNINSPGGDVNDGLYIHDLLAEHPSRVETVMRGLNASASTIIGQAGDTRKLSDNGMYLVHTPMIGFCGMANKFDVDLIREDLEKVESRIINLYEKRSGKNKDFKGLMEKANGRGVWLEPKDALDYGFIDEIYEPTDEEEDIQNVDTSAFQALGIPMPDQQDIDKDGLWKAIKDLQEKWDNITKELHNEDASAMEAISRKQATYNNIFKQEHEVI